MRLWVYDVLMVLSRYLYYEKCIIPVLRFFSSSDRFSASEPQSALISINVGIFVYVLTFVDHWTPTNLGLSSMIRRDIH